MNNNSFVLRIQRTGFVNAAAEVKYIIDNNISGALKYDQCCEYNLPKKDTEVHLFYNVILAKRVENIFKITPRADTQVVTVVFKPKMNWLNTLTILGLFKPTSRIEIVSIQYN